MVFDVERFDVERLSPWTIDLTTHELRVLILGRMAGGSATWHAPESMTEDVVLRDMELTLLVIGGYDVGRRDRVYAILHDGFRYLAWARDPVTVLVIAARRAEEAARSP